MPLIPLPLVGPAYQNLDEQSLDVQNAEVRNLFVNEAQFSEKRPGLASWVDLGTSNSIDGLYWWDTQSVVLAVSNGQVWKITDANGTKTELTAAETLQVGQQVSFDDNGTTAVMANGGKILTTTSIGPASFLTDADAPTTVSFVGFIDQYLVAGVDETGTFQISDVGDLTTWRAIDVFTAESKPDVIKAVKVGLGEIVLFGSKSIEFWANDGVSPFSRINQATIDERGVIAPHSIALVDDRWILLDSRRKVIEIRGRQPVEISQPFDKVIQGLSQVETAIGGIYHIEGLPLYILSFPQDLRTLVYNYKKQDWAEWDYFNQTEGTMERYRGNAYCYAKGWNLHLVGDHSNGKIYTASTAAYDDNGTPIRCVRRSGFISHGNYYEKECRDAYFRVKQSVATSAVPNPQMMVRYRNDRGAWKNERWLDLGPVGDHGNIVRLNQCGQYRTRQWEVAYTEDTPFVLADAQEDVEVLAR